MNEFGISEEDLNYLSSALKIVKDWQKTIDSSSNLNKPIAPTEKEKKNYEERAKKMGNPEDFFNAFNQEVEEFYPYGQR